MIAPAQVSFQIQDMWNTGALPEAVTIRISFQVIQAVLISKTRSTFDLLVETVVSTFMQTGLQDDLSPYYKRYYRKDCVGKEAIIRYKYLSYSG